MTGTVNCTHPAFNYGTDITVCDLCGFDRSSTTRHRSGASESDSATASLPHGKAPVASSEPVAWAVERYFEKEPHWQPFLWDRHRNQAQTMLDRQAIGNQRDKRAYRLVPLYTEPTPNSAAEEALKKIRQLVDEQAEDDGLWCDAEYAPEAYLQQELRRLHRMIETTTTGPYGLSIMAAELRDQAKGD